jgi:hypothetical protein
LLSYSGGVTTARHSAGKQPHRRSCYNTFITKPPKLSSKIFLFWGLIFKTDVDKIKITTGEGTQDGSYKPEREKNID